MKEMYRRQLQPTKKAGGRLSLEGETYSHCLTPPPVSSEASSIVAYNASIAATLVKARLCPSLSITL